MSVVRAAVKQGIKKKNPDLRLGQASFVSNGLPYSHLFCQLNLILSIKHRCKLSLTVQTIN